MAKGAGRADRRASGAFLHQRKYTLEQEDVEALVEHAVISVGSQITLNRKYKGQRIVTLSLNQERSVADLLEEAGVANPPPVADLDALVGYAKDSGRTDLRSVATKAKKILAAVTPMSQELVDALVERVPTFFYFSDYSRLAGDIDLHHVTATPENELDDADRTARSLLGLVRATAEDLGSENLEKRIAELEAAASEISRQVFAYWTQNPDLHVHFVTRSAIVRDYRGSPTAVEHRFLNIRLLDRRHDMTTNFETRSSGFRWFFSFIVAFDPFRARKDIVVLLDEPGLSLHGRAQADFLRFIDEQLAPSAQVIYTTHSPFLVDPSRLERVRVVEDHTSRENLMWGLS